MTAATPSQGRARPVSSASQARDRRALPRNIDDHEDYHDSAAACRCQPGIGLHGPGPGSGADPRTRAGGLCAPAPTPALGVSGLTERKPDLCGATKNYGSSVGQPGSVIPTLGITKDYRVVEYRGIEPQDYDPNRIVFRLDAAGTITNVDCG
ncbi:hypothetical protein ACFSYD_05905 [Paracoccus aerius]